MKKSKKNAKSKGILLIKKSNDLIESRYKFDVWEMRFFLSVLSKIEKDDEDFDVYRIKYRDVIKDFDIKSNRSYELLKEAAKSIMDKSVTINYEENGVERAEKYHVIRKINYLENVKDAMTTDVSEHEYIDVTIEPELRPFLIQLSKNFTAYDLRNVAKLGSYAIRIYELLKQYESIGTRKLSIDEMKQMLEVVHEYPLFANFYQSVIEPSIKEINKSTDLKVATPEKVKDGKRVVALVFRFARKPAADVKKAREEQAKPIIHTGKVKTEMEEAEAVEILDENTEGGIDTTDAKEKLIAELSANVVIKLGVSLKVFMALVEKHTETDIRQAVTVTEKAVQSGRVTNSAGFFVEALRGKYQDNEAQKKALEVQQMMENRLKAEAAKQAAQIQEQAKSNYTRSESERKMAIIRNLMEQDADILYEAIEQMKNDVLGRSYDANSTIEENLKSPMLAGVLMNYLVKINPHIFD
jgi:plasmid replication initiation protein